MLARIHQKSFAYDVVTAVILALEAVFGLRAALMWGTIMSPFLGGSPLALLGFQAVAGVAVAGIGFVVAAYRQQWLEAWLSRIATISVPSIDTAWAMRRARWTVGFCWLFVFA